MTLREWLEIASVGDVCVMTYDKARLGEFRFIKPPDIGEVWFDGTYNENGYIMCSTWAWEDDILSDWIITDGGEGPLPVYNAEKTRVEVKEQLLCTCDLHTVLLRSGCKCGAMMAEKRTE